MTSQKPSALDKPFTIPEVIEAMGIKFAEERKARQQLREEMQAFCRAEIDRVAQRLRSEALQSQLDFERSLRASEMQQRAHRGSALSDVIENMVEINPRDVN